MATAPRSLADLEEKSPWKPPMGVRAAPTITTGSFIVQVLQISWQLDRRGGCVELIAKTDVLRIRKHVFDMAVENALLAPMPEIAREQIGMVLHEGGADLGVAEQEAAELFRENVVLADRIPGFGRHFVFLVARFGDIAEIAVGD